MNFKPWLLLNENIEENFDKWLENIFQYAKTTDRGILNTIIHNVPLNQAVGLSFLLNKSINPSDWSDRDKDILFNKLINNEQKNIIKIVLKQKNLENYNWFAFSIGFLSVKPSFLEEDLELAIDVTKRRIDSRDLLKTEIGQKGWLVIGADSLDYVNEYLASQQQISNRAILRMKKKGETLGEDEKYIRLLIQEDNYKVYILPNLNNLNREELKNRHMILCKYGKGTKWCTANPGGSYADYYSNDTIYIVHKNDSPIYQFVGCKSSRGGLRNQFMNTEDRPVKELEKNIYNLLNNYLKEEINCYNISRAYSLEEIFQLSQEEIKFAYEKMSIGNIKMLVDESDESQAEIILKNLFKYRDQDWITFKYGRFSNFVFDKSLTILSFINKLGVYKFIEKLSVLNKFLINDFLLSIIIRNFKEPEKVFDFIKKIYNDYPKIFKTIGNNNEAKIIFLIIKEISKLSKDKVEEIINLLGDKINLLSYESIEYLIKNFEFNIIFPLLDNKHSLKIDTKLMDALLLGLSNYSGYIEKTAKVLGKSRKALLRSKIPVPHNTKAREMEFIKYILTKSLSNGAIELLLKGKYLNAKSAEERLEKIEEIAKLIGSERITKIKNYAIKDMISDMESVHSEEKEKLKRGFIDIIKKYHKKLPADFFTGVS